MELVITLLFGLTIFLGTFLYFLGNSKKMKELSISTAFGIMFLLIIFEIFPEANERVDLIYVVVCAIIGLIVLKVLDIFIPDHDHHDNSNHLYHIGLMTSITLVLHNIIEGAALYGSLLTSKMGILVGIGVGLHNIPLGMILGSTFNDYFKSKKKTLIFSFLISLSTFLGGIIMYFIPFNEFYIGIALSITLGMLIYIVFFELLEHLHHQDRKNNVIGLSIGALIFIISLLFHHH